ncbi:hypothetical protein [Acuticoccus sediminis]|uniref:hypothetical protein n=1 Tax=Acuticoccus sediminis TaxID=2184697 RepID=UPI001CFD2801|nr:hypothetical protein [Acuticoccus sediminis]
MRGNHTVICLLFPGSSPISGKAAQTPSANADRGSTTGRNDNAGPDHDNTSRAATHTHQICNLEQAINVIKDKFLSKYASIAEVDVAIEKIDIADWLFNLPEAEYNRCCSPDHIGAGTTATDDGRHDRPRGTTKTRERRRHLRRVSSARR